MYRFLIIVYSHTATKLVIKHDTHNKYAHKVC